MVDLVFGGYEIDSCPAEKMNVKHKFSTNFPLVYYHHSLMSFWHLSYVQRMPSTWRTLSSIHTCLGIQLV